MTTRDLTILGCSSQQPTRRRNHGAYLVRWNNEGFLFDPGEGTQRQFIYANIASTVVSRMFISHFHGDHCLGFPSMLMRFNLDHVQHVIHCYYPQSGKKYFDRLKSCASYYNQVTLVEHAISSDGLVHDDGCFRIEAAFLDHSIDCLGWRIKEPDMRKFDREKLESFKIVGPLVHDLKVYGEVVVEGRRVTLEEVSWIRKGDVLAVVIDTRLCENAYMLAQGAQLLLCEATYLEEHADLAYKHKHITAKQAATLAKEAGAQQLILTHFSARYQNLRPFYQEASVIFPGVEIADDLKQFSFLRSIPK